MKIGILGAGHIACKMAETINAMDSSQYELYAVGSSDYEKSKNFAEKYSIKKAYGSYEEFVKDEEIDLVYVATIHTMHFEHALLCLENGKNVLVEKPFTVNKNQAEILFKKAKEKNLLISEAMWTRYMPSGKYLKQVADSKVIGDVTSVNATIGYNLVNVERMINLNCAGGALLDIGIYTLHFAMMVLGDNFTFCKGVCLKMPSGVDGVDCITMKWENAIANLQATMMSNTGNPGYIYGSEGYLKIDNINNPKIIDRYDGQNNFVESVDFSDQITGFEHEVMACCDAIKNGKTECDEMPHSLTLQVIDAMDELRKSWAISYPCDKK